MLVTRDHYRSLLSKSFGVQDTIKAGFDAVCTLKVLNLWRILQTLAAIPELRVNFCSISQVADISTFYSE